jgi:hypothetical protein
MYAWLCLTCCVCLALRRSACSVTKGELTDEYRIGFRQKVGHVHHHHGTRASMV